MTIQEYQYRTFENTYHFKDDGEKVKLKITTPSDPSFVSKKEFKWIDIGMPLDTLSEVTATKILSALVQKGTLSPRHSPSRTEIASPELLDARTVARLLKLEQHATAMRRAADLSDQQAIIEITENPDSISRLITSQKQEDEIRLKLLRLKEQKKQYKYYHTFYVKMTGILIDSFAIKGGFLQNANPNISEQMNGDSGGKALDYLGWTFEKIGQSTTSIPGIGLTCKIIGGILRVANIHDNYYAIKYLTDFFEDFNLSLQKIQAVALILTQVQEKEIDELEPQGRLRHLIHSVKDWCIADESDNPVVIKAIEDCGRFLTEIFHPDRIDSDTPPEKIASRILGRTVSKPTSPPPIIVTMPSVSSPFASDSAGQQELSQLREQLEIMKTEMMEQQMAFTSEKNNLRKQVEENQKQILVAEGRFAMLADALELDEKEVDENRFIRIALQVRKDKTYNGVFKREVMSKITDLQSATAKGFQETSAAITDLQEQRRIEKQLQDNP